VAETAPSAWARLPLSRRLVIGLLAVMSVALLVVAAATYVALRAWMTEQIDASLMQPKQRLYAEQNDRGRVGEAVQSWTSAGATVVVVEQDGTATPLRQNYPGAPSPEPLSSSDAAELAAVPTAPGASPVTVDVDGLGKSRAVAVPAFTDGQPVTVVSVLPLSRVDEIAGRLVAVEVVAVGLALLFVSIAGTWFVRRSLRPLQDVAETAGEVASLPLERGDVVIPARVQSPVPTTEVGQVGMAVNAMLDHVESSLQTRADTEDRLRRFVSDAGHELRTPLAAVRGYSELMRRGAGADPAQAKQAAERIEAAASRMGLLVEDLLLLASLDEERPLARDELDLRALVDEAVAEAATAGPDHQWSVVGDESPVQVVGDGVRLHQAIANLLANARAHTPAGTRVRTSLTRHDGWAYIDVLDDGPGFPAELLPRATERFARGDASRSRATGGSGLGLSIVKAVVEAHGGGLLVTNAEGAGALVRIRLPLVPTTAPVAMEPPVPAAAPPA
jgi:two-component system OmpR family sensor kinase